MLTGCTALAVSFLHSAVRIIFHCEASCACVFICALPWLTSTASTVRNARAYPRTCTQQRHAPKSKTLPSKTLGQCASTETHQVSTRLMLSSGVTVPLMSLPGSHASGQCTSTKSSCWSPKSFKLCCTDALQTHRRGTV